jgi:type II secretory pathway component PulC
VPRNKAVFVAILFLNFVTFVVPLLNAQGITYDSGKRRDPLIALTAEDGSASSASSSGLKLEGIIYDPESRSMAVLNGKTYQAGESVGEATITKILKDHVVISVAGEEKTLWIRDKETPE